MILHATATFTPRGDLGRFIEAYVTPSVRAAVEASTRFVFEESQRLVPVDTGELRASGKMVVQETAKTVRGDVIYDANHAAYVEYGTGRRGSESAGAGPYAYNMSWPGMAAQPYLRPALDRAREVIRELFRSQVAIGLRA